MTFEKLKDTYVYLRSMRRLFGKSKLLKRRRITNNILIELDKLFEEKSFGNEAKIKAWTDKIQKKGLGPEIQSWKRHSKMGIRQSIIKKTKEEDRATQYLIDGAKAGRARVWKWRLQNAIQEAVDNGWYPMFGTYTVDERKLPKEFLGDRDKLWKETPAWDQLVKRMKVEIGDACGLGRRTADYPKGDTLLKYFAVIEHGKTGKHPHVHVIWLAKNIPDTWKHCPNRNSARQDKVDITHASVLWEHGIQRKTQALFIIGAPWADENKLNWRIPLNKKTGEPQKTGDAAAVAGYMGKYLTKGETKTWNHRIRATRGLGLKAILNPLEKTQSLELLKNLAHRPDDYSTSMRMQGTTNCPMNLLRKKSKEEVMKRLHISKKPQDRHTLWKEWTKTQSEFFTNYLFNVKDGVKPWRMKPSDVYSFYSLMLEAQEDWEGHSDTAIESVITWISTKLEKKEHCKPMVMLKGEYAI